MASQPIARLKESNTKENLWIYVLRILKDGPTHAYTIREEIRKKYGFRPGTMTAYKVLYGLKKRGLVTKKLDGRKKVYSITAKGKAELKGAMGFYQHMLRVLK
ncbi:MAG: PadR family transcriptional regulator [Candidatus Aenigmarchaeota archaeon]